MFVSINNGAFLHGGHGLRRNGMRIVVIDATKEASVG
jgi:hypothetical protein